MGVIRKFTASCDACKFERADQEQAWVSCLKDDLREEGWRVNNKLTCPACLGTDPDYWNDDWSFQ
jgi:hypothetical protein